jgi:hypothetical protein
MREIGQSLELASRFSLARCHRNASSSCTHDGMYAFLICYMGHQMPSLHICDPDKYSIVKNTLQKALLSTCHNILELDKGENVRSVPSEVKISTMSEIENDIIQSTRSPHVHFSAKFTSQVSTVQPVFSYIARSLTFSVRYPRINRIYQSTRQLQIRR